MALADRADEFERRLQRGAVAFALHELGREGAPATPDEARQRVERITALWSEHAGLSFVAVRRGALEQFARVGLRNLFDADPPAALGLAGRARAVGADGSAVFELHYDFTDAGQLDDFLIEPGFLSDLRRNLAVPRVDTRCEVEPQRGQLVVAGATALRHRLDFQAPLTVTFQMISWAPPLDEPAPVRVFVGLFLDEYGNGIRVHENGDLLVLDSTRGLLLDAESLTPNLVTDHLYHYVITHGDQGEVRVELDGTEVCRIETDRFRRGGFTLWFHSEFTNVVRNLVLRGTLDLEALAGRRVSWVEAQLAERLPGP